MPTLINVHCYNCGSTFLITLRRHNEAFKRKWHFYCSTSCQNNAKFKGKLIKCSNSQCHNTFYRIRSELNHNGNNYCSQSCAATVNNAFTKIRRHECAGLNCSKQIPQRKKFCSRQCFANYCRKDPENYKKHVIEKIRNFVNDNGRIPFKSEQNALYMKARKAFGTWNKAIESAGFSPNPLKFSKKFIAQDGHKCDSFSEKIIDDWLFKNAISHQRNVPYPGQNKLTADFVIEDKWIEFFGLLGSSENYRRLVDLKFRLAKCYHISLLPLYKSDVLPSFNFINKIKTFIKVHE
jgi:hypothetical protein